MTNFRLFRNADDYFKFDENGRKLSKLVENTVGKGEIARYEQFLLFQSVFKRLVSQGSQKVSLCGNGLKEFQESMGMSTGLRDITEITLKNGVTYRTINQ